MGYVLKYDISLPPSEFETFMDLVCPKRKENNPYTVYYGHVGDGNVHINIVFESLEELYREQK
jgi:D-2-hydroxyglutarate dehydrogenase